MQASHAVLCLCCGSLHRGQKGKQRKELNEAWPRNKLTCMFGLTKVFGNPQFLFVSNTAPGPWKSVGQFPYWNAVTSSQSG
jgi:hypothetical protein